MKTDNTDSAFPTRYGAPSNHSSPILNHLGLSRKPDPWPACADCPASRWYVTVQGLRCFCTAFHSLTWTAVANEAVMACDARELAILAADAAANR